MSVYLRKYGAETKVDFALYKLDGTGLKTDAASASGDVTLYRDEADVETLDADAFTDEGAICSLTLSATEMQASRIIVCIVDQSSPQVWLDKTLIVETYGNASAQHPFDLATATQDVNVASIDDIDLSATMKASVNAEVDTALNTAIPGGPTADSINERVATLDGLVADSKIAAQVKGQDNIDFGALQKTSLNAATPAVTVSDKSGFSLAADQSTVTIGVCTTNTDMVPDVSSDVTLIKKYNANKWAIVGTQLIFYDDDGTTPIRIFNLDSATAPTSRTPA